MSGPGQSKDSLCTYRQHTGPWGM